MKILFLDIDGVLVHRYSGCEPGSLILTLWDQQCADRVMEICRRTGALIVVQSTWGWLHKEDEMRGFFKTYKFPDGMLHPDLLANVCRGNKPGSIRAWMDKHKGEFDKVVNIDDEREDFGVPSVTVSNGFIMGGIQSHHVEKAVKILEWPEDNP
jgi:hypothetical protein